MYQRPSRLGKNVRGGLLEHFVAGTTARAAGEFSAWDGRTLTILAARSAVDVDELQENEELVESWRPRFRR